MMGGPRLWRQSARLNMSSSVVQAYEELAYPSGAFAQMHPERLATIATLFGMQAAPVERCRVLELGCGNGASLIPFAHALPHASFLGIDITPAAIRAAHAMAAALGLRNADFRCANILEIDSSLGAFDYILCHGVYSWVPPEVREKLLAICGDALAPSGVAYISYNTRPGGDLRVMLREMMRYHIPVDGPLAERLHQARALVEFLAEAKSGNDNYQRLLQWQRERIERLPDALLYHDDLSESHQPVYFHQFVTHAAQHGLQFLGEADFYEMGEQRFPPAVREKLAMLGDRVTVREQYMDFLCGRAFRQTLLCRADQRLQRPIQPESLSALHFSSPAEPISAHPAIAGESEEEFRAAENASVKTTHPLAKAIFVTLGEAWPGSVRFDELRGRVAQHLGAAEPRALAEGLLQIYSSGPILTMSTQPYAGATRLSERPQLSPLARVQAESGCPVITNLRHFSVDVRDPLFRRLLLLLDGTRDRAALADALATAIEAREIPGPPAPPEGAAAPPLREQIAASLDRSLRDVLRMALLVA